MSGRRVRSAWRGVLDGRTKKLEWDGRDDAGREAPTGVYLARLRSGTGKVVVKLIKAEEDWRTAVYIRRSCVRS